MRIRVVFLQDVPPKYLAGDIHEVAAGYARNYLIPNMLAAPAVGEHLKRIEKVRRIAEDRRVQQTADMTELAQYIEGKTITLVARASDNGRLYGSITSTAIAEELSRMLDRPIERRLIYLPEPIKEIGTSQISVRLFTDIAPTFNLVIEAESGMSVTDLSGTPGTPGTQGKALDQAELEPTDENKPPTSEKSMAEIEGEEPEEEKSPTGENSEVSA